MKKLGLGFIAASYVAVVVYCITMLSVK